MNNNLSIQPSTLLHAVEPSSSEKVIGDFTSRLALIGKEEKEVARAQLKTVFDDLNQIDPKKTTHTQLFTQILGSYGSNVYPEFKLSLPYLYGALQLQLHQLNHLPSMDFSTIHQIEEMQQLAGEFQTLENWLKTTDSKSYPALLNNLTTDEKLRFAKTLFTLGAAYSNLKEDFLKMEKSDFFKFKTQIFTGEKELLLSMDQTETIQKELGELQYNIFPGLYADECRLNNDGNISKEEVEIYITILNQATQYNPTKAMKARIANLTSCRLSQWIPEAEKDKERIKSYNRESSRLWKEVLAESAHTSSKAELEGFRNLIYNVDNGYLSMLLKEGKLIEEMNPLVESCQAFIKENGEKHPYSMIHLNNLCAYYKLAGKKEEALDCLKQFEAVSQHHLNWPDTKELQEEILATCKDL